MLLKKKLFKHDETFGKLIASLGALGLLASLLMSYEKYSLALDPSYEPSCSLNPIVACESVLTSATDALFFGVPNSFFGIAAFAALMAVGVMMIAGAKFKDWFWKLFAGLTAVGIGYVAFFVYQSLYVVGSLCLYCMTTWVAVIPLALYTFIFLVERKQLKPSKYIKNKVMPFLVSNHLGVLFLIFFSIFGLILFRFRDYFETVF